MILFEIVGFWVDSILTRKQLISVSTPRIYARPHYNYNLRNI